MKTRRLNSSNVILFSAACLLLTSCVTGANSSVVSRAAVDTPDHFMIGYPGSNTLHEPAPGQGCSHPLIDPRDGLPLSLSRSANGHGDYQVPPGHYGVKKNELLRIDCATGKPLGIVNR